jgi:hypothetical protein
VSDAFAAPASRNASCPCGSGRRWKDCHGRRAAAQPSGVERSPTLAVRMQQALLAQRSGRFAEAIAAYGEVIDAAPDTCDAWHMRGVAHLQSHAFDEAEADIRRALALKPDLPLGRSNLALVDVGRRMAAAVERLSRDALPRFRPLVVDPPVAPLDGLSRDNRCHVVDLGAPSRGTRAAIAAAAASLGATVREAAHDDATLAHAGGDDLIVAVGGAWPAGDWAMACAPRAIALVVDGASVADVEDRLRELSAQGRRRVRLAAAPGAGIDLSPLPHAAAPR